MALRGWYPDPGGQRDHFRYWDGQAWSSETSTDPTDPAPAAPAPNTPASRGRRRRLGGILVALGALVLVLVVVGASALRDRNPTVASDPVAPSSAVGDDDTSPSATPSTGSPSAVAPTQASPTPLPTATLRTESCPVGDPTYRQEHPTDGRIHGGGLSMPAQAGWPSPGPQRSLFSWAYDVGETDIAVQPTWYTGFAVGAVSVADGFDDPQRAAELAMECSVSSGAYRNIVSRTDLVDEASTVDGHRAWTIRSEIRANDPRTSFAGDVVEVTAVDLGSPEALAFFWGCAPIGSAADLQRLDQTASALTVD